ncbi:hypothetical protein V1525DRAFT_399541 [Lipomyces kononenkoae]|uniref:Uncharacterized protein n=1 Tax=Lipomyces kononenkoae TaxID=34357 RepID=A0ACC3T503_LIPKO
MRVVSQIATLFSGKQPTSVHLVSNSVVKVQVDFGQDDLIGTIEDRINASDTNEMKKCWRRLNLQRKLRKLFSKCYEQAIREDFLHEVPESLDGEPNVQTCFAAGGNISIATMISIHEDAGQHIVGPTFALADTQQTHSPSPSRLLYKENAKEAETMDSIRELSTEINSEKPLTSSKLLDGRRQYIFATEPSQILSETDDIIHTCIDDTLEAINAYLRSIGDDADPTLSERASVPGNVSFNSTSQNTHGNSQNMYDVSAISGISSSVFSGELQKESDSVIGLMTTFAHYMLSVSEDRDYTDIRTQLGSSMVCDGTNASLLRRNLKPQCHDVLTTAKYEQPFEKTLINSWDNLPSYPPGNNARFSSPTLCDQINMCNQQ